MIKKSLPYIGCTMGDPAGIGPELVLRICSDPDVLACCVPVVFGDTAVLERVSKECKIEMPHDMVATSDCAKIAGVSSPIVVDCGSINAAKVLPGKIAARCGRAAYRYIEMSIEAAMAGQITAVVTAPINKEALNRAGVNYPGHTEIFTALTESSRSCMMLTSKDITVSFVTTHLAYAAVTAQLTAKRIADVIELTHAAVELMKGRRGKLLLCALNPHAGEHGLFGNQENRVLKPAVKAANKKGIDIIGPISPDAAFLADRRAEIDAYVCMYHDQGHIPFKMLAFDTGVNVTLGLPIVRTSVDHGTAFDIAWQGTANPRSLVEAVLLAEKLSRSG